MKRERTRGKVLEALVGDLKQEGTALATEAADAARRCEEQDRQGLTLVPIPAQLELTLHLAAQIKITLSPM